MATELVVRGRVQGVGFRYATAERARRHSVRGWAANRADGSVEVVLEGPSAGVEAVAAFCRRGPRGAWVEGVEAHERAVTGLTGFRTL